MATSERIPAQTEVPFILYRFPIYGIAIIISLFLLSILPILSFGGYVWEWIMAFFVFMVAIGGIASGIGGIVGLFINPGVGIVLLVLAWLLYLFHGWLVPQYEYFVTCSPWFYDRVWEFFYDYSIGFYAWTPLMLVSVCGGIAGLTLFSAQFLNFLPRIIYGRVQCPHSNCDYVGGITIQCPHCRTMISNLAPTRYGIFSTACPHCQHRLATGWYWGKNEYSKHCSLCFNDWNIRGLGTSLTRRIIIAGSPKSGKTSFLIKSIAEMHRFYAEHIQYTTDSQEITIQNLVNQLSPTNHNTTTPQEERPAGIPILFNSHPRKMLAYFYDSSGNEFQSETTYHLFYENADGIVLLLDPFAEPKILEYLNMMPNKFPSDFETAEQPVDIIVGKLCKILERVTGKGSSSVFHLPLCVVLTKTEMFNLYKQIDSDVFSMNHWEEHSRKVQEFLRNCGLNNFLGILESRFKHTMFFASSAYLNFPSDEQAHNSTLPPAIWMMRQIGGF